MVGYPGIFLVGLLSSSSVFLPLPGLAGTCAVAILLNPFIVGVVAGILPIDGCIQPLEVFDLTILVQFFSGKLRGRDSIREFRLGAVHTVLDWLEKEGIVN